LVSSKGQELVCCCESTSDALKLFHDLVEHFTTYTPADIEATEILNFLTYFKLVKDLYKHSTSELITYWIDRFCEYDEYPLKGAIGEWFTCGFSKQLEDDSPKICCF